MPRCKVRVRCTVRTYIYYPTPRDLVLTVNVTLLDISESILPSILLSPLENMIDGHEVNRVRGIFGSLSMPAYTDHMLASYQGLLTPELQATSTE